MLRFIRFLVSWYLITIARSALALHKPYSIAITGSVGKTTTKDMLAAILAEDKKRVRASAKSYNSLYGVPLSILDLPSGFRNPFVWIKTLMCAPFKALFRFPTHLVLEVGLEYPGDITDIVSWLRPNSAVMTKLATHPVHGEHFSSREDLYAEKFSLLQAIVPGGTALCNYEDPLQQERLATIPTSVTTRYFNTDALSVVRTDIHYDDEGHPIGTDVVLSLRGKDETFYIPETLGNGAVQCLVAAVAAALVIDETIEVRVLRRAIASRKPTLGRMHILPGKKGSIIIDDSYNASPVAMEEALEVLGAIRGRKKIAVLGVMAQLGKEQQTLHMAIGKKVASLAKQCIVVGDAPFGSQKNIHYARDHEEALQLCLEHVGAGTVFLCKGSQVARIERVVSGLLADHVDQKKHLVRQEDYWLKKMAK